MPLSFILNDTVETHTEHFEFSGLPELRRVGGLNQTYRFPIPLYQHSNTLFFQHEVPVILVQDYIIQQSTKPQLGARAL